MPSTLPSQAAPPIPSAGLADLPDPAAQPTLQRALAAGLVWSGDRLAEAPDACLPWPSGHPALDAVLPGGGWPGAGLTDLLQGDEPAAPPPRLPRTAGRARSPAERPPLLPQPSAPPLGTLLAPALAARLARAAPDDPAGPLVLIGLPTLTLADWARRASAASGAGGARLSPFAPALARLGLPPERIVWVRPASVREALWACAEALGCGDVPAVVAWLPEAPSDALRRLHLKALESGRPLFAWRPGAERHQASPAPLRLWLPDPGPAADGSLTLQVCKRRGPPLTQPLRLDGWMSPWLHAWPHAAEEHTNTLETVDGLVDRARAA